MPKEEAVYPRIAREFTEAIESGALAPGSALPKLDDLAASAGVSRSTMQRALLILEDRGLVRPVHGKAIFVRTVQ